MTSLQWLPRNTGLSKRAIEILRLLAGGLSDREIAEQLVMTINTVKWYNRQIYRVLGVGSRSQAIARAHEMRLLDEDPDTPPTLQIVHRAPSHDLPAETTAFVGRDHETQTVKRLLETAHLLTLVGPPGTGKTRLALQIGREVADTFRDGCRFVSLAPINDPALVTSAIASAIGVVEIHGQPLVETLKQALRERQMLLILDNFEHLLPAATQVSELLSAAPHLKALATSREPLHLYGEQEYAVPPLVLPNLEQLDPPALADCESAALFLQRAQAVRSDFALTEENASDVAKICLRLEGLPLAIELAAARIRVLTPKALLARLTSRLDTLTGGAHDLPTRQQTLQNTIAWSYNLLSAGEQMLFARLAVFRGDRSLEAIEAICREGLPADVFDALESLVNKSLIQRSELPGGESRYAMLETLREYAWERLKASGEAEMMQRRHAVYFVRLAERAEPELRLAQQWSWFRLLKAEHENMRAVLAWSLLDGDPSLGARLAGALCLFWYACGYHNEGQQWTQQLLDQLDHVDAHYHAKLLFTAGHITVLYDLETARAYFDRALSISRKLGDRNGMAWALAFKGYAMMNERGASDALADEGLAIFEELDHKPGVAQALNILGELAAFRGDHARARQRYEECLAVSQETGEMRRVRYMFGNLATLAQYDGDYESARGLVELGLWMSLEMDNELDVADSLKVVAGVLGATGQPEQATRLLGVWQAAMERMGAVAQPAEGPKYARALAAVRAQLDPRIFEAAWTEGRAMSLEQAAASVLAARY